MSIFAKQFKNTRPYTEICNKASVGLKPQNRKSNSRWALHRLNFEICPSLIRRENVSLIYKYPFLNLSLSRSISVSETQNPNPNQEEITPFSRSGCKQIKAPVIAGDLVMGRKPYVHRNQEVIFCSLLFFLLPISSSSCVFILISSLFAMDGDVDCSFFRGRC